MTTKNLFFAVVLLLTACAAQIHYSVMKEPNGTTIFNGQVPREVLEKDSSSYWFKPQYDIYALDQSYLPSIEMYSKDVEYLLFLGTWCSDSHREVPHLLKIFDNAKVDPKKIRLFCVDRTKKAADGSTDKYQIKNVPTLIVLHEGKELGRIVESPIMTLEIDLAKILAKQKE